MNTKAYFKLVERRAMFEEQKEDYDVLINELRTEARKFKKGSAERQDLMRRAQELKNCDIYKIIEAEIRTMNFCINTVFYN